MSFTIRSDQENDTNKALRQKHNPPGQQKRSVLGVLSSNVTRASSRTLKQEKPNLKPTKDGGKAITIYETPEDEETASKCKLQVDVSPEVQVKKENIEPSEPPPTVQTAETVVKEEVDTSILEDVQSPMQIDKSIEISPKAPSKDATQRILFDLDDYRDDIYDYLLEAETRNRPKPNYMRRQPDITYTMRTILVEWMVEVAEEYRLQTETLYLAVSYIDRFLSLMSVVRAKLQLVGTAAMFIAAKYEEIYPPDVGEFVYITDDTYTKRQVLRMEHLILKVLDFNISSPTALSFITKFCVSFNYSEKIMFLAMYIAELTLLEGDPYLQFHPSVLAASAISLARHTLGLEAWPADVADSTGYQFSVLKPCLMHMTITHARAPGIPQQAVREKYKHSRWHEVSQCPHRPLALNDTQE